MNRALEATLSPEEVQEITNQLDALRIENEALHLSLNVVEEERDELKAANITPFNRVSVNKCKS